MILHPNTVELTKIHYYKTAKQVPTISREIFDNQINKNLVIKKKNVLFGQKWILKINEISGNNNNKKSKFHWQLLLLILIFICVSVILAFGIYFTFSKVKSSVKLDETLKKIQTSHSITQSKTITHQSIIKTKTRKFCPECSHNSNFICLKQTETGVPKCLQARDRHDPTGCGGFCTINTHFCQLLDAENSVYQCSTLGTSLKCANNTFNCGNRCIQQERKCDGIVHCSNKSDELNCECNLEKQFWCTDRTSCLDNRKKCNGIVDCFDKSDELNCAHSKCKNGRIPCRNGECIEREKLCDGIFHCSDHSDEVKGCQNTQTS